MIELAPNIYHIPGENNSRFPYCACLYLKGRDLRVLIDAGMGSANIEPAKKMGIDILILTHCHIDHRLTRSEIPYIPVWCHKKEALLLQDKAAFYNAMGLKRSGLDVTGLLSFTRGSFEIPIAHELNDGDRIDLGNLTLETIHTPGHTPGHIAFFIPEHGFLFTGDVDLTPFGPFYGHDFADIEEFLVSIDKLKRIDAAIAVSGHAGPFNHNLAEKFDEYQRVIHTRDQLLLKHLNRPKSLAELKGANLFYRSYPEYPELIRWFELVHIEKHLQRLTSLGEVRQQDHKWVSVHRA